MGTWHPDTVPDLRDATFSRVLSGKTKGHGPVVLNTERPLNLVCCQRSPASLIEVDLRTGLRKLEQTIAKSRLQLFRCDCWGGNTCAEAQLIVGGQGMQGMSREVCWVARM